MYFVTPEFRNKIIYNLEKKINKILVSGFVILDYLESKVLFEFVEQYYSFNRLVSY